MTTLPPKPTFNPKAIERKIKNIAEGEHTVKLLLEKICKLYYDYKLCGEVSVTKGILSAEAVLTCEIDGTDGSYESQIGTGSGTVVNKIVDTVVDKVVTLISIAVDKLIRDLIERSRAYWDKPYKDHMTLAGNFSFSDPNGILSVSIECSATVKSLHDYIFRENEFEYTFGFKLAES